MTEVGCPLLREGPFVSLSSLARVRPKEVSQRAWMALTRKKKFLGAHDDEKFGRDRRLESEDKWSGGWWWPNASGKEDNDMAWPRD